MVTALRRSESLQDTPAAVTAFDAQAIRNAGIERPADFIALTPNVNLVETQNAGNAFVIIRGYHPEPQFRAFGRSELSTGCSK